jgi:hypothetical protein
LFRRFWIHIESDFGCKIPEYVTGIAQVNWNKQKPIGLNLGIKKVHDIPISHAA